jgi:riboflavin kinase/FMN adenylyltransferase
MQIFDGIEALSQPLRQSVVTIGNFDGIHRGHQKLLEVVKSYGQKLGAPTVVMTFHPHPISVLFPNKEVHRLFSLADQDEQLEKQGIDYLIRQKFDSHLAATSAEDFFQNYLLKPLRPKAIIVGHDFHFGKGRQGDFSLLKKWCEPLGILVEQVSVYQLGGQTVSTSKIRELLSKADLAGALELLGRNYYIQGKVESGFGRGKKMGFPTANIAAPPGTVLPRGVYVTKVHAGGKSYGAVTNVGLSPTFEDKNPVLRVENFIFDFNDSLYHENITVEFFKFLRPEKKFKDVAELTEQISHDVRSAQEYWNGKN